MSNAPYSTVPTKGEFPPIGSPWYTGIASGKNSYACPFTIETGTPISKLGDDYDSLHMYPADTIPSYYAVINRINPLNTTPQSDVFYVWSSGGGVTGPINQDEPYINPRTNYMMQAYDVDQSYCDEEHPTNPFHGQGGGKDAQLCSKQQSTLDWFRLKK